MKYVFIILIFFIIGCATGKNEVRNDYIPCEVCGGYDNRSVFLYDVYGVDGKHIDLVCHMECFNNLIKVVGGDN